MQVPPSPSHRKPMTGLILHLYLNTHQIRASLNPPHPPFSKGGCVPIQKGGFIPPFKKGRRTRSKSTPPFERGGLGGFAFGVCFLPVCVAAARRWRAEQRGLAGSSSAQIKVSTWGLSASDSSQNPDPLPVGFLIPDLHSSGQIIGSGRSNLDHSENRSGPTSKLVCRSPRVSPHR